LGRLLLPLVAGYALAGALRIPPWAALAPAAACAVLACLCLRPGGRQGLWGPFFGLAAVLCFWAHGMVRLPHPPPSGEHRAPVREARLEVRVERLFEGNAAAASGIARVLAAPSRQRLEKGSRICFRLEVQPLVEVLRGRRLVLEGLLSPIAPDAAEGPGSAFSAYLANSGVFHLLERARIAGTPAPAPAAARFYAGLNARFRTLLSLGEPPGGKGPGGVYRAMLLGRKVDLGAGRRDRYRDTGTLHLFAISGLHIGVIALVLNLGLQVARVSRPLRPVLALPLLYLYVQACGAPPSAVRAFLMALFFWFATSLRRQRSPVAAVTASAAFVLLVQPGQFGSPGFQLSYSVVLGILLFGLPLHAVLAARLRPFADVPEPELRPWERKLAGAFAPVPLFVAVGLAAWLASAPLCAAFFGVVAPGGIILNLLLVHLASLVIVTGVLSLLLGLCGLEPASAFLNHAAWPVIGLMDRLVGAAASLPGASFTNLHLSAFWAYAALAAFFALLLAAHRPGERRLLALAAAPGALLLVLATGLVLS
jgi:competence protein ComEC